MEFLNKETIEYIYEKATDILATVGAELDMCTGFNHFGPEAAALFYEQRAHNETVRKNRRILRESLTNAGFRFDDDEWWHFDYGNQTWAAGNQDVGPNDLIPDDDKITVLGASSDHLVMDITGSDGNYKVGDTISFRLSYGGILRVMTSAYVEKVIL